MAATPGRIFDALSKQVDTLVKLQTQGAASALETARTNSTRTVTTALTLVGLASITALALSWLISGGIMRPLKEAITAANAIASGDLSCKIEVDSKDEIGQLKAAMQTMVSKLTQIIGEVNAAAGSIASTSAGRFPPRRRR